MKTKEKQHLTLKVIGHVQGVGYRQYVHTQAEGLGVTGYVQNNEDGTVTIEAEGDTDTLHELIDLCSLGSPKTHIDRIDVEQGGIQHYDTFLIRM